ncbi:MAG: hypothetical protein V2I26_06585 [Halieaceae bacterium]|jgi:hypothetical protein|nr:hypothetical protein [Halieaceae bacterium]
MHAKQRAEALIRDWQPCPGDIGAPALSGDNLGRQWTQLHAGDLEPYPQNPTLQDAWRRYHEGDFARAVVSGLSAGAEGLVPSAFAITTYACYLEQCGSRKRSLLLQVMDWCERAQLDGRSTPNLHYVYALAMNRYSQAMSMIEIVTEGFGLRIREQAERCLALEKGHSDAHLLLGAWHAQMCTSAGQLMAAVIYGANRVAAITHYELAIELAADSPVPYLSYATGLELMFADSRREQEIDLLTCARSKPGIDAKQRLDQRTARTRLQALYAAPAGSPVAPT